MDAEGVSICVLGLRPLLSIIMRSAAINSCLELALSGIVRIRSIAIKAAVKSGCSAMCGSKSRVRSVRLLQHYSPALAGSHVTLYSEESKLPSGCLRAV